MQSFGNRKSFHGIGACRLTSFAFAATVLFSHAAMAVDVASQADWNNAVAAVAAASAGSTVSINLTGGFTLTSSLAQLQASNTSVTVNITGNGKTINGASSFQGIQVNGANAPTVNISSLTITNTAAVGGRGAAGQNGFLSGGLSYGSGGGGGGGLGAGGGLFVGSGANVTLASVTFTGNNATGGAGGAGGVAQNAASSPTGGNGGAGGALNAGNAGDGVGGGGAGGTGGNTGTQGSVGTAGATLGAGGGGGGGSGTTNSASYTWNNAGSSGSSGSGHGGTGGDGVTNNQGSGGPGADGGSGGSGGAGQGGAIYVATGGTVTILDSAISGASVTGGVGGAGGAGQGPSNLNGQTGSTGAVTGAGIFLSGVTANIGVSSGTVTYADAIAGTGLLTGSVTTALNKTGNGVLALTGTNTFVGNIDIDAGTLSVTGTANLGNAGNRIVMSDGATFAVTQTSTFASLRQFRIAGQSTFDIAGGTTSTIQGVISDGASSGSLVKTDAGKLILSGANTYTGQTTVNAGTLALAGNGSLATSSGVAVASGATVDFSAVGPQSIGTLSGGGNVALGARTLTSTSNADSTFSGVLSGTGGFTKVGSGALILNGINTYTGLTTVSAGTLEVGDINTPTAQVAGSVLVGAAGTLRGHGTVLGNVTNDGTVRPGGSIGKLTVNGNYSQSSTATLAFDISPTAASQLKVNGTATLAGTVQLLFGPGTYTSTTYRLIAANAIAGSFSNVISNTPSGITLDVAALATGVDAAIVDPSADATPTSPGAPAVVIAPTNATIFGELAGSALRETQRTNEALLARLGSDCGVAPSGRTDCAGPQTAGWVQLTGQYVKTDGENSAPGFDSRTFGFLAGLEQRFGDWTGGVATGYTHADVSDDTGSKGTIDAIRVAAYGGRWLGPVNLAGTVGTAYDFLSTTRRFGQLGNAEGNGDGQEFHAGLQASLPLSAGPFVITPRAGARYAYYHSQSFSETGPTSQDLGVGSVNLRSLQPFAGLSFGLPLASPSNRPSMIEARVGYAYETLSTGRNVAVTAGDGTGFVIAGVSPSRGMFTAGLGAKLMLTKVLDLNLSFDALIGTGNTSAEAARVELGYRF
ncbi:autotransporter domain-containing protein [Paraburkholderia aromaticivorans]|uniref:autotransporter domain-containing protein n=1 Tax=Paraburkholderia aromaticivorans TaxID=2026199 RepID=UPI001455F664|nr:autotransporter domain-containing protein [Paraburkholderia aromaticivorans]